MDAFTWTFVLLLIFRSSCVIEEHFSNTYSNASGHNCHTLVYIGLAISLATVLAVRRYDSVFVYLCGCNSIQMIAVDTVFNLRLLGVPLKMLSTDTQNMRYVVNFYPLVHSSSS